MGATMTFKLQDKEAKKIMENLVKGMSDFTSPLKKVRGYQLNQIDEAFNVAGKNITGTPWPKLSPNYLKSKMKAGFLTNILVRTGKMRSGFKQIFLNKNELKITNTNTDYFKYHQSALPRKTKLPRRQMLGHSQVMIKETMRIFSDYLIGLMKKGWTI